ncbi:hypothetical protein [Paenirhodobacter populi]|uniref:hypothetical protein n=1 Tax=Paenirhodobacter populi TaxID=2306993 RepID=UPI000FE35777|nr:hypothetical protein [Sinirhodobacter populi]RWR04520.1 hypothetical protein D2T32_19540 [Sinirhodobacter populi]
MTWNTLGLAAQDQKLTELLTEIYIEAEALQDVDIDAHIDELGIPKDIAQKTLELARIKHAFRGAALTLLIIKSVHPGQDIRAHKAEYDGGISARSYDSRTTIPFLIDKSLPRSVESHWLTQTLSFAGPLIEGTVLKTQPRKIGPQFIEVINAANADKTGLLARRMAALIMFAFIEIRNKEQVVLTKPKSLPIVTVETLLRKHMAQTYKTGAPRLPQIAIYAIYRCLMGKIDRFKGQELEVLARMKSADRKAGTVGDIVVTSGKKPVEAVEIKFNQAISMIHVLEAIDKVRAESVSRYYLLSTIGVEQGDRDTILAKAQEFEKQNGCEIIVNGVFETVRYYLRLLPDTTEFLSFYADILGADEDVGYEHRIAWNDCCAAI